MTEKKRIEQINTKAELDEYLAGGVSGDIYKMLGVTRVHFYPFDYGYTDEEEYLTTLVENPDILEDNDDVDYLQTCIKAAEGFIELRYSTVYKGLRFYFADGLALKHFCDIVES